MFVMFTYFLFLLWFKGNESQQPFLQKYLWCHKIRGLIKTTESKHGGVIETAGSDPAVSLKPWYLIPRDTIPRFQ
jgi:hypothetical protein